MSIAAIHSFLVHPSKNDEKPPEIGGTELVLKGKLFEMLAGVYAKAEHECRIDIAFNHNSKGEQQNPARDLIVQYVTTPTLDNGREIATRLQTCTTRRSGLGLL